MFVGFLLAALVGTSDLQAPPPLPPALVGLEDSQAALEEYQFLDELDSPVFDGRMAELRASMDDHPVYYKGDGWYTPIQHLAACVWEGNPTGGKIYFKCEYDEPPHDWCEIRVRNSGSGWVDVYRVKHCDEVEGTLTVAVEDDDHYGWIDIIGEYEEMYSYLDWW